MNTELNFPRRLLAGLTALALLLMLALLLALACA